MQNNIKNILITAATHGNEMSGIHAVKKWQEDSNDLSQLVPSAALSFELVNKSALAQNRRFVDEDLNRQFTPKLLKNNALRTNEQKLAKKFNEQYGPKEDPITDFLIDIHNTTSNMGPTLIILVNDDFHQQLARYVKKFMPSSIMLIEDYQNYPDFGYLCTVGRKGVMIEVGPQPQGLLKAQAYQQTIEMTASILKFVELYNAGNAPVLPPVEAFRLGKEVFYPTTQKDGHTVKEAMIHPSIDNKDFCLMKRYSPCFVDFNGNDILWQEDDTYPHFIGEAAYNHLHIAFATSEKCLF